MYYRFLAVAVQILLLFLAPEHALSQALNWKSFTSVGTIEDIEIGGGRVWSGSNGGVLQFELSSQAITKITNTEGLASNEVVAVEMDKHGAIWFALFDGLLNRYFPETGEWEVIDDYRDQIITDVVAFGDSLYVGLDIGVSLYTIDKREVKETYKNFGLSDDQNLEKIAASGVFIDGLDIWVATDKGVAQSSLTFSNLLAPANWQQYTTEDGLPTDFVHKVVVLNSVPYAATDLGVYRLNSERWRDVGNLNAKVTTLDIVGANQFFSQPTIVTFTASGVFWLDPSDQWRRLGAVLRDITALKSDEEGNVWIGRRDKGLATFVFSSQEWQLFETNSPRSNNFRSLALDSQGRLWCASQSFAGQSGGVQMFDGERWTNFSTQNGALKNNDQRTVAVDSKGRIFFGSWGGGITVFEDAPDGGFNITTIDTTDGILAGSVTPSFVLVNAVEMDQFGNIWALNRQANNTRVLVAFTPDDRTVHFSTNEGLFTPFVTALEIDRSGRVWVGTDDRGIKVLNYKSSLFDKSDDDFTQGLVASEGLFSNAITALADDDDGVMWIATEEGVNFWFEGNVGNQFGLINDFANTIGIDALNNKWFGTVSGVTVLDRDRRILNHYTTGNSPIVSGNIQSFAFNEETGEVWIGTTNGLSRLETPFTAPKADLSLLTGYPNPYIIDGTGRKFTITNLAADTRVMIYNVAGKMVKAFDQINGAQVTWNGEDEDNEPVPSGIYVYLAITESGVSNMGKVAVVRR
ncbi:T9SS type A sorting domain-containing protein [candidate division KSB1 bacterium]|nr:T9SS type A sorting domain-containing protein [candidate division KSB1 bacterium]NIR73351.1 T9SS type A sorting domain-containing protein [candidate division KSB1 bacterium]NIS25231.1 T9SS type A sorting domain-containing protein [candidate division KSB1 bacterium]NIT72134.1 T9SS type A sorting domain-containing protein [candidate division KSB1 bacterium]NIU25940.1 T9SS type A sorting domain-containing protein [candidate division KSB1 bacterium]